MYSVNCTRENNVYIKFNLKNVQEFFLAAIKTMIEEKREK